MNTEPTSLSLLETEDDFVNRIKTAGLIANSIASQNIFQDYRERKAQNTLRRQKADLKLFSEFLRELGLAPLDFAQELSSWTNITWGLVAGFVRWQVSRGYAVSSVNVRLSTIKTYSQLAMQADYLDVREYAAIKAVQGYRYKESHRLDLTRKRTRVGKKKAEPVTISTEQARLLKSQPNTPKGRRDNLLMCLLLDHGLRVGEVTRLQVYDFDLKSGLLKFFRPKVCKEQTHRLTKATLSALKAYYDNGDMPLSGCLLRKSKRNSLLAEAGMTERGITKRVRILGEILGLTGLSAHDCRHYWASTAARNGTDPFVLQEAGGWSSLAMPRRYVEEAKIANEGVILE